MYKMLVLDLDDTLLSDDMNISNENKLAINKAMEKGVQIVFCSGRTNESMKKYIDILGIHSDKDFIISYNGAKVDQISGKNIFYKPIKKPLLTTLINIGYKYNVSTQLYTNNLIVEEYKKETKKYEELSGLKAHIIESFNTIEVSTKVLYNSEDIDILNEMKKEIEIMYSDKVNTFFSKPTYLEVLNIEANKGLGVKYLANVLNIDRKEIIAVGDSYNDLSMVEYAGMGVVVKNGREGVKKVADYITEKTNNENAIAEVINKYIL